MFVLREKNRQPIIFNNMLSRKSRKIRTSEPIAHDIPANNILIELTTPVKDGTIPLLNFLENTERFLGDNAHMLTRVYELEREVSRYKADFRQYDGYLEKISRVMKTIVDNEGLHVDDVPIWNNQSLLPTKSRTIRHYFKPIGQNRFTKMVSEVVPRVESISTSVPRPKTKPVSNPKMKIDQQMKENVQEMEEILSQMKQRKNGMNENIGENNCNKVSAETNDESKLQTTNDANYSKIDKIRLSYDSSATKTMFTSSVSMFGLIKQGDVLNIVHDDTVNAVPSDYLVVKKIHSSRTFETTSAATSIDSSAADSIASESPNLIVRQVIFRQSSEQVSSTM